MDLTHKQKKFADNYLENGNGTQAALDSYDIKSEKDKKRVAASIGSENLTKPDIKEYLADKAKDAASMVYKLSQEGKKEEVRLNASKDILDRSGYKPTEKKDVNFTGFSLKEIFEESKKPEEPNE